MVNATCEKCGALHRFEDADVPPSGKVMKCTVCGHALTVMHATAAEMGFAAAPTGLGPAGAKASAVKPPAAPVKPPGPPIKPPGPPIRPPGPPIKPPAPPPIKPPAAAGAGKLDGGPARSAFDDDDDGGFSLDDGGPDLGLADVPAPKRPSPLAGAAAVPRPAPRSPLAASSSAADFFDLELPPGRAETDASAELPDLLAPVGPSPDPDLPDLLAPVGPSPTRGANLPGGAASARGLTDLPAPVGPSPTRGVTDLPAPVGPRPSRPPTPAIGIPNLPAPVGPTPSPPINLPAPVGPTPSSSLNLPAPVGPVPTRSIDLPAPKGFFDDIPQPASAPPGGGVDLPAPKGFFDDIPAPASARDGGTNLPAPKGFFDDIPQPAAPRSTDLPAPRGFFDDIPAAGARAPAGGPGLDLDELDLAPPSSPLISLPPADPGPGPARADDDAPMLELDGLELDGGPPARGGDRAGGDRFGEVDLPEAPGIPGVVTFSAAPRAGAAAAEPARRPERRFDDGKLEIDEAVHKETVAKVTKGATVAKQARAAGQQEQRRRISRMPLMIAGAVIVVGGLAAGGWYLWSRRQAAQERGQEVARILVEVRAHIASDKPLHWDRALAAAEQALQVDDENSDALGLAAQAAYAGWLDEGTRAERRDRGQQLIGRINTVAARGVEVDKAEALRALVEGNPQQAARNLEELTRSRPADADVWLYLGWAWAAAHEHRKALTAFDATLKRSKDRLPALYGRAQSLLALGASGEALKAFAATSQRDEQYRNLDGHVEHLGAMVGAYQLGEVRRFSERESRYLEITTHPQRDKADPRAISMAWSLAGDQALAAGRGDEARRRYDQALALDSGNLRASTGIARVDHAQGRLQEARAKLEQILVADPGNLEATLALSETLLALDQPAEAQKRVSVLLDRKPPLDSKYDLARAHMVQGAVHERAPAGRDQAIAEYEAAVALVGAEDDIRPTVALARSLAAHDDAGKRARAIDLLRPIEKRASTDPAVAVSLGLAYAAAGKLDEARAAFQSALDHRPNDVEALFQLGLTLHRQKRHDEAIATMKKAFAEGGREDVGLELARIYEALGRDGDAGEVYQRLVAVKQPTINVRVRAGRYHARLKDFAAAAAQGAKILEEQPQHPAGLFLRAEGLAAQGKYADAVRDYQDAVAGDPDPQYLDGLGRALERLDPPNLDDALKQYKLAAIRPDYLGPRLGIACVRLMKGDQLRDPVRMLEAIADAQRLAPGDPWLDFAAGLVHQETRKYDLALAAYRRALAASDLPPEPRAYIEYRRGLVLGQLEKSGDAARALTTSTRIWEDLEKSGAARGDWPRCPLRAVARDASPPPHSKDDEPAWVMAAYQELGYRERDRNNRRAAIEAWDKYLQRVTTPDDPAAEEIRRLRMRLKAH